MLQEYIFKLVEFGGHAVVLGGKILYAETLLPVPFLQLFYVRKHNLVLKIHVVFYFLHVFVKEFYDMYGGIVQLRLMHAPD